MLVELILTWLLVRHAMREGTGASTVVRGSVRYIKILFGLFSWFEADVSCAAFG